jgi:catechol-2,3-dioxygenase
MRLALFVLWSAIFGLQVHGQKLPPGMTIGNDGPADPATLGIWTNHIGLNVRNLTASMQFYGDILGMRHIFTIQYTDTYSLTYMGFAQVHSNRTNTADYQLTLFREAKMAPDTKLAQSCSASRTIAVA